VAPLNETVELLRNNSIVHAFDKRLGKVRHVG